MAEDSYEKFTYGFIMGPEGGHQFYSIREDRAIFDWIVEPVEPAPKKHQVITDVALPEGYFFFGMELHREKDREAMAHFLNADHEINDKVAHIFNRDATVSKARAIARGTKSVSRQKFEAAEIPEHYIFRLPNL